MVPSRGGRAYARPGRRPALKWKKQVALGAAVAALTLVSACSGSGGASGGGSGASETLKLGMADSSTSPTYKFAQQFASNVSSATGGKIKVQIYPSSGLGAISSEITGVQSGSIAFLATPDLDSVVPDTDAALLPYLFTSMNEAQKVLNSSAMHTALWDQFKKYNLTVIGTWPIGPLGVMSRDTNVSTLTSLKGQRIRVLDPLVMSPLLKAWGMDPTPVDPNEVLQSLSTGLIDGAFDPPTPITSQGWDAYAKSYMSMNAVFNVDPLVMSTQVLNGLSASQQKAVTAAFDKTLASADTLIDSQTQAALGQMKTKGISIYTPSPASFQTAAQSAEPTWEKTFGSALVAQVRAVAKAAS